MEHVRRRLAREDGFTLIELLIVIVVIGILLAIAVPSYLGFKEQANQRAAAADVRAALPTAEGYFADEALGDGSYAGMNMTALRAIDQGIKIRSIVLSTDGKSFCLDMEVGDKESHATRGAAATDGGDTVNGPCPGSLPDVP